MRRISHIMLAGALMLGVFAFPVDAQDSKPVSKPDKAQENSSSSHRTPANSKYARQPSTPSGVKSPGFSNNTQNTSNAPAKSNDNINRRPTQNIDAPGKINNISTGNSSSPVPSSNNKPNNGNNNNNNSPRPGDNNNNNNNNRPNNGNNNNNNNSVNKPGNNSSNNNRPNNGYRPNNSSGPNYWPGSNNNRPNNGYKPNSSSSPRPNINQSYHYGHYCPPPARPYRPIYRPLYRPVLPPGYRPYYNAPVINNILGLTFGMAYVASLDYLFNKGYNVDGYNANTVYLRDVRQMMFVWDDATLNYSSAGYLDSMQFVNSTSYDDTSRYDSLYNEFCKEYGSPVSISNTQRGMQATWFGRDSRSYITIEYQASYSSSNYLRYYTVLTYGY